MSAPRSVVVLGGGKTALAVAEYLLQNGVSVFLSDSRSDFKPPPELIDNDLFQWESGRHSERCLEAETIIPSPGIPPTVPIISEAVERGIEIISEIEFAFREYIRIHGASARRRIIAVTGTNGKTTTARMLGHILERRGETPVVCGNIGVPFIRHIARPVPVIVEVSSFQLHFTREFHPAYAFFLNFDQDHLEWHGNVEEYFRAKCRMIRNLAEDDSFIANADILRKLGNNRPFKSRIVSVGEETSASNWAITSNKGRIIIRGGDSEQEISVSPFWKHLEGPSRENALFAIALGCVYPGLDPQSAAAHLSDFEMDRYRMEKAFSSRDSEIFNDSKSTNPHSLIGAVTGRERPFILVMGGYDKGLDYGEVREILQNLPCRKVFLLGPLGRRLYREWKEERDSGRIDVLEDYDKILESVSEMLEPGVDLIFSPGSSSFDRFQDYRERGKYFGELVTEWATKRTRT